MAKTKTYIFNPELRKELPTMTEINERRKKLRARVFALLDDYFMDGFNGMAMRKDFLDALEGQAK